MFQSSDSFNVTIFQVIDMQTYSQAKVNIRSGTGGKSRALNHSQKNSDSQNPPVVDLDSTHIAFGQKVAKPPVKRRNSSSKQPPRNTNRENDMGISRTSNKGKSQPSDELCITNSKPTRNSSHDLLHLKPALQPHPPKCTAENVRKPRVKSADLNRQTRLKDERKFSKSANIQRDRSPHINSEKLPSKIPIPNHSFMKATLNSSHKSLSKSEIDIKSAEQLVALKHLSESGQKSNSLSSLSCADKFLPFSLGKNTISLEKLAASPATDTKISSCNSELQDSVVKDTQIEFKDSGVMLHFSGGGGLSGSLSDSAAHDKSSSSCELLVADDDFEQEYLRKRTYSNSRGEDDLHSPSSSCTTSNNSDSLFLYSSRPKSVSERGKILDRSKSRSPSRNKNSIDSSRKVSCSSSRRNSGCGAMIMSATTPDSVSNTSVRGSMQESMVDSLEVPKLTNNYNHTLSEEYMNSLNESENAANFDSDKTFVFIDDHPKDTYEEKENNHNDITVASQLQGLSLLNSESTLTNDTSTPLPQEITSIMPPRVGMLKSSAVYNSCESDDMSWMNASVQVDKEESSYIPVPKQNLRQKLEETFGSVMERSHAVDSDDDGYSDGSDDTFVSPPVKIHNYRYQDEMNSLGATLDLAATIPMTPQVGDQVR